MRLSRMCDSDLKIVCAYAHYLAKEDLNDTDKMIKEHLASIIGLFEKRDQERLTSARTQNQIDRDARIEENSGKNPF